MIRQDKYNGPEFLIIVILRPAFPARGNWTRFSVCGTGKKLLCLILLMLIIEELPIAFSSFLIIKQFIKKRQCQFSSFFKNPIIRIWSAWVWPL
jgi:hypothetical protein